MSRGTADSLPDRCSNVGGLTLESDLAVVGSARFDRQGRRPAYSQRSERSLARRAQERTV